jgi:hypothetical protein
MRLVEKKLLHFVGGTDNLFRLFTNTIEVIELSRRRKLHQVQLSTRWWDNARIARDNLTQDPSVGISIVNNSNIPFHAAGDILDSRQDLSRLRLSTEPICFNSSKLNYWKLRKWSPSCQCLFPSFINGFVSYFILLLISPFLFLVETGRCSIVIRSYVIY